MNLKNKKAIITGAGGFIGSHLLERLVPLTSHVKAFVHYNSRNDWGCLEELPPSIKSEVEVIPGDIQDSINLRKAFSGCDVAFHLAAVIAIPYSYMAPEIFINTNVKGTLNVVQASLDEGLEKVVHTSTSETYGTAIYVPIDEKHPLQGQSPYSASKIGADKLAESYYRSFGLPVATIRPFNTFGPRQSARAIIPTIVTQILTNEKEIELGLLTPVRDLSYVDNIVDGFIKVAQSERSVGEVINVGSGSGVSVGDLAKKIMEIMGKHVDIKSDVSRLRPEKSEVMRLICNYSKAKELAGWEPAISLEEGLKRTIDYIRENIGRYKADLYTI
jgi:NAD dependent epimerase/dehydratase